ncbi:Hypothetical protein A7982_09543 [Minicystis rosea]|nr:Hypothetical protein A7982_09543 [Minicystis rosea]
MVGRRRCGLRHEAASDVERWAKKCYDRPAAEGALACFERP